MQTRLIPNFRASLIVAILACLPAFAQTSAKITEADDAFHYRYWNQSLYKPAYTEWWYFNLYDEKDDLQAIFSYQVSDPQNLSGQGISFVTAVAFQGNRIVNSFDPYPLAFFSSSYRAANVTMGPDTIAVPDPDTYQIRGSTANGRITWDLLYDRQGESWLGGRRVSVAPEAWERMSWLLYMPRAHVSGTVIVDGKSYSVNSSGYHDHNWGEWDFAKVRWNWAQYSDRHVTFDLGDFIDDPNGKASISVDGERTVFNASQYRLVHTKWVHDSQNNSFYPVQSVFTADNGAVHLSVTMDIRKTDALASGLILYEQPTHFKGAVTIRKDDGVSATPFEGDGFKEYTAIAQP